VTQAPHRHPRDLDGVDAIVGAVREDGHRVTAAMRIVVEALVGSDEPVAAADIAAGLGGRVPALDLTSVYRNLERLQEVGAVVHLHVGHGAGLYALARGGAREFLVCERCGRVTAVDPAQLDELREGVRALSGYAVRFDHFPLHGLCPDCAAA
jgi:Fur family ferric uptake transcriptional regulator